MTVRCDLDSELEALIDITGELPPRPRRPPKLLATRPETPSGDKLKPAGRVGLRAPTGRRRVSVPRSTVASAFLATCSDTLPWSTRLRVPRPRVPITIVSNLPAVAIFSISLAGSPAGSIISASIPFSASTRRASSSSWACTSRSSHGSIGLRPGWTGTTLTTERFASNRFVRSMAVSSARFAGSPPSYASRMFFISGLLMSPPLPASRGPAPRQDGVGPLRGRPTVRLDRLDDRYRDGRPL